MGRRGPRPEPTALKILRGEVSADAVTEPTPDVLTRVPTPPTSLKSVGKKKWKETAKLLIATGVMTAADLSALELYARSWDELEACRETIAEFGAYYCSPKTGVWCQHPSVNRAAKLTTAITRLMLEFGLTPASRTGVAKAAKSPGKQHVLQRKRG